MKTRKFFKFFLIFTVLESLVSCRTFRVVEQVPVYFRDTVQTVKVQHDSTFIDRWHSEYIKGDTVYVRDSFALIKQYLTTDTAYRYIERPVVVSRKETVEVEKKLRWWQKSLMWMGAGAIVFFAGVAVLKCKR